MRSAAKRYAVAALAFLAAATWLGVSVTHGIACLFAFVLALHIVTVYQRRSASKSRGASARRDRPSRYDATPVKEDGVSHPTAASDRSRPARRIYDGGREEFSWPVASEATW